MRKFTLSFIALMCAIFISQNAMAANEEKVLFSETFETDLGKFKEELAAGPASIWQWFFIQKKAFADAGGVETDSRLIAPETALLSNNVVTLNYTAMEFADLANQFGLSVRTAGGEWTEIALENADNTGTETTAEFAIPSSFNNKAVEIAIRYNAANGIILVSNFVVKGSEGGDVAEKADAAIAYDVTEMSCTIGEEFTAPVLANPNNLAVTYSSSDMAVATVDETGAVTVLGEGVTTIKAVSAETDAFKAGAASYVLTVSKAGDEAGMKEIFSATFENGLDNFKEEITAGANNIWQWFFAQKMAYADAGGVKSDSRLVSPEVTLLSNNVVSLNYIAMEFTDLATQFGLSVRKIGGEWTEIALPNADNTGALTSVEFAIPAEFDNQIVEIGLRYNASAGILLASNFVVKGKDGGVNPGQKADPELSFDAAEVTYDMNSTESYYGPALNNPYNVVVKFASSDGSVAAVSEDGGVFLITGEGFTEITATSVETDEYRVGRAKYVLQVTNIPTGIEGVAAQSINDGKIYDLQGRRVNKLEKGIFIINGKKVVIK